MFYRNLSAQQQLQLPDYGLLQDLVPSFSNRQKPWIVSAREYESSFYGTLINTVLSYNTFSYI